MTFVPSAAGRSIAHSSSFRAGVAHLGFVVPASARSVQAVLKVVMGSQTTTKSFSFAVQAAPKPSVAIDDATAAEGNAGTTTLSFPVSLSAASRQPVSVSYTTADGTATSPADYARASGTLTFAPGETQKSVAVSVVGDLAIEGDETLTVTLSSPTNATIASGSATGTITNDDTQVTITNGDWRGSMQTGDYLYFTVQTNRQLSFFRVNDVRENCSSGGYVEGTLSWAPTSTWPIAPDGSVAAANNWTGSLVDGDFELTAQSWKVTANFNGSSATGTMILSEEFNYQGAHYSCSTGQLTWTAQKL